MRIIMNQATGEVTITGIVMQDHGPSKSGTTHKVMGSNSGKGGTEQADLYVLKAGGDVPEPAGKVGVQVGAWAKPDVLRAAGLE